MVDREVLAASWKGIGLRLTLSRTFRLHSAGRRCRSLYEPVLGLLLVEKLCITCTAICPFGEPFPIRISLSCKFVNPRLEYGHDTPTHTRSPTMG